MKSERQNDYSYLKDSYFHFYINDLMIFHI